MDPDASAQRSGSQLPELQPRLSKNEELEAEKSSLLRNSTAKTFALPEIFRFDFSNCDHRWNKKDADITDYFNYGYNEETWKLYVNKVHKMALKLNPTEYRSETENLPESQKLNELEDKFPIDLGGFSLPFAKEIWESIGENFLDEKVLAHCVGRKKYGGPDYENISLDHFLNYFLNYPQKPQGTQTFERLLKHLHSKNQEHSEDIYQARKHLEAKQKNQDFGKKMNLMPPWNPFMRPPGGPLPPFFAPYPMNPMNPMTMNPMNPMNSMNPINPAGPSMISPHLFKPPNFPPPFNFDMSQGKFGGLGISSGIEKDLGGALNMNLNLSMKRPDLFKEKREEGKKESERKYERERKTEKTDSKRERSETTKEKSAKYFSKPENFDPILLLNGRVNENKKPEKVENLDDLSEYSRSRSRSEEANRKKRQSRSPTAEKKHNHNNVHSHWSRSFIPNYLHKKKQPDSHKKRKNGGGLRASRSRSKPKERRSKSRSRDNNYHDSKRKSNILGGEHTNRNSFTIEKLEEVRPKGIISLKTKNNDFKEKT